MAGLPGSGKSAVAVRLERAMGAVVLDKDRVRAALFPPRVLDYSAVQDDLCMAAIYQAAAAILEANPRQPVVLDGRTFLRPGQVRDLLDLASSLSENLRVIECVCDGRRPQAGGTPGRLTPAPGAEGDNFDKALRFSRRHPPKATRKKKS